MKKVVLLSLLSCLLFPTSIMAAEDIFRDDSFFRPVKVAPKSAPKAVPKVENAFPAEPTPSAPAPVAAPQPVATPDLEASTLAANAYVGHNCPFWWVIAAIFATASLIFAIAIKKLPRYFGHWHKSIYYYVILIAGLVFWMIHYYLHFIVYKYDLSFLCYNYWLVIGFEVVYFWLIFALIFGVRTKKIRREVKST